MDEDEHVVTEEQPPAWLLVEAAHIGQLRTWLGNLCWSFRMLRHCCDALNLVSYRYRGRMDPEIDHMWHEIEMAEGEIQGAIDILDMYISRARAAGINIEVW